MLNMDLEKLHKIDEELTTSEVAALKFLCMDFIGRKHLETVRDAKDLFQQLIEKAMFEDKLLLPELLYTIGRSDLLDILGTNKQHLYTCLQNHGNTRTGVSAYRKMLYKLSEDITDKYLQTIKFLLNDIPKTKLNSATFLDILIEMEKMERLGEDNLDKLESVLGKCSKMLASRVQEFKEAHKITKAQIEDNISKTEDPTNDKYSHQEVSSDQLHVNEFYPLTRRPLGHCLIINNFNFKETSKHQNRNGTDTDKDALTRVFQKMHFVVEERRDLSSSKIHKVVKEFSEKDHSQMDAFVCCILSHGQKGSVLGIDGEPVLIRDLTQPFAHCSTLTSKPKIFFIQACQDLKQQKGECMTDGDAEQEDKYEEDAQGSYLTSIPVQADFLIGMATVEDHKSFRHPEEGSPFIQELCLLLEMGCPEKEDMLSILTKVNANMSSKIFNIKSKQMPECRYTITKKLVLPMD